MTQIFKLPIDLEALADALAPMIAERLAGRSSEPFSEPYNDAPQDDTQADPWASEPNPNQPQHNQPSGNGAPRSGTFTDSKGKKWTFGKHGAPSCEHGTPAAFVQGTSQNGKAWKAWACPLGYGDSWKNKCDLFQFTR